MMLDDTRRWMAVREGEQAEQHAETTLKYAQAVEKMVKDYLQSRGENMPQGVDSTHGNSGASPFSSENPLKFIKETPGHYIEAHFQNGSYYGFSGEAYHALVGSVNSAQEQTE